MKRLTIITVTVGVVASLLLWTSCAQSDNTLKGTGGQHGMGEQHVKWVIKCLTDFYSIKPGMTREEIEKRFPMDGGEQGVSPVRFTHPECPHFKIDVEFSFKRNPNDQNRAVVSPEDKATKISKPYLELFHID